MISTDDTDASIISLIYYMDRVWKGKRHPSFFYAFGKDYDAGASIAEFFKRLNSRFIGVLDDKNAVAIHPNISFTEQKPTRTFGDLSKPSALG